MNYREKYLRRAVISSRLLRFVPFLRMAGLNGSIVRGEETEVSDIDFLIIARDGRLYTARFFASFFIHLTGWRRYGDKAEGRICLNCYLSDKNPDISPKNPKSRKKVARAYRYLIPMVDVNNTAGRFFEVNGWMKKYQVVGSKYQARLRKKIIPNEPKKPVRFLEIFLRGKFGNWFEKKLMNYQRRRILAAKKRGDETVATTREIRLHPKKKF